MSYKIFLDEEDVTCVKKKTVFIDGQRTKYKLTRVSTIADSKNISKYKNVDYTTLFEETDETKLEQTVAGAGGACDVSYA